MTTTFLRRLVRRALNAAGITAPTGDVAILAYAVAIRIAEYAGVLPESMVVAIAESEAVRMAPQLGL